MGFGVQTWDLGAGGVKCADLQFGVQGWWWGVWSADVGFGVQDWDLRCRGKYRVQTWDSGCRRRSRVQTWGLGTDQELGVQEIWGADLGLQGGVGVEDEPPFPEPVWRHVAGSGP